MELNENFKKKMIEKERKKQREKELKLIKKN